MPTSDRDPFVLRDEGPRADHSCMAVDPDQQWANVESREMLVGRRTRFARFLGLRTDERASNRGANGELVTGWWLGRLPEGWHVINEVPVGDAGAYVDHLVIGPSGIFTINTKNLSGKVWVGPRSILYNRRSTDFLPRASAEARRASRLLAAAVGRPVDVRGVLAILCDDWTIKRRPAEVYVDATRGVKDWMLRQPAVLRAQEVIELAAAASRPGTWVEA